MTEEIEIVNDAHRVLSGRIKVRDDLKSHLDKCDEELERIDEHARKNNGQVPHPPVCPRPATEVLRDRVATQNTLDEAQRRVDEAKEEFDRRKADE